MDSERAVQIRMGAFTLLVLVAAGVVVLFLTQEGGLFTRRYNLYANFENVQGLTQNAPVWLAGNNVGRVTSIDFRAPGRDKPIRVELEVDASVRDLITTESLALIGTIGLLGDKYVEVSIGAGGDPIAEGESVATIEVASFTEFTEKGSDLLDNLVAVSGSTERILGQFEQEMGGESLAETLGATQRILQELAEGEGFLHALIYDDDGTAALTSLARSLTRIEKILDEVESGQGTLHALIYDDGGEEPALGSLIEASRRLDSILTKIDEGQGTMGALVNDPGLYEDLRIIMSGAKQSALLRALIEFVKDGEE